MKTKLTFSLNFAVFCFILCLTLCVSAQNLTVREIMAEPSIAGMRVEGEKLSPDGTRSFTSGTLRAKCRATFIWFRHRAVRPEVILRNSDLPVPTRTPREGEQARLWLEVRDDFVKERENQLGNFEWSPDSKKLVFSYGGDLYVTTLGEKPAKRLTQTQSPEVAVEVSRQ